MAAPRSLILVTVDCLRADHVGFLGYEQPTTPFLDSLAPHSLILRNAIVAGAPTYYSFPAIMASRYPLALGRDVVGLAPQEPTLASVLQQRGYVTAAFVAGNPYLSRRFGYDTGFDHFQDFLDAELGPLSDDSGPVVLNGRGWNHALAQFSHKLGPLGSLYDELYFQYCQRRAGPAPSLDQLRRFPAADFIVDRALEWLASVKGGPFFLWLHLMDPHSPYYPPQQSLEWMGQSSGDSSRARYLNACWNRGDLRPRRLERHREEVVRLYDCGIRWVDAQLKRLRDGLPRPQSFDDCIFALTADHGEEFLDHGGRYHPPSTVTEELIHVPLLLRVPGAPGRDSGAAPFSLLHLAPTLLDAMDISAPAAFGGLSAWPTLCAGRDCDGPAIVECVTTCTNPFRRQNCGGPRILAVREARYKLVVDFRSPQFHLFDLESDPGELRPLPDGAEKRVRRRLLEHAQRHLANSASSRDPDLRLHAILRDIRLEWAHSSATNSA